MFEFNTVEEAVEDLKAGKIILVTDDEDRENEVEWTTRKLWQRLQS